TDQGYVRDTGDSFHEYYDGERGSIPDEYRVMTFQDDLPEEEKSEWAMDIAFDMDEFFRQNDPQYAAEHPEAHAAKEELYESLMAGRISALDEKLAALGQTQEDYLPSEIEKFKDATGYEEFLDFDPAEVKAALDAPEKSHADEMLAFAEKAEREYAAEIAAYVQTPADIAEQAQAVPRDTFSIYQLKPGDATRDYRFEPLDAIRNNGLSVKPENYELVYTAPLTAKDDLESIYTRFNVDRPADFTGHSLSVSDIVVLHQDGKNTAHYCDRVGFSEVPEFLQERQPELTPDDLETGECIRTPRGSFYVTAMSREQMEAAGYGVHHISDDGKYLIMGNGTRAFAVAAEQPEKDNPLRTAEMTLEDDYGMIDGVINNGRRGEELEKAQEYAERTTPEKSSIRERLEDAKRECAEHKPQEVKKPGRDVPEHDCL
ncbi:YodL domain-containing protein, partial [Ruthenibacterium lactatiformans]|uniref:YodL domain-containing protein n=1 Tax=Ruthenibacterium lactatiformans TaxID=1550024 RepID=UPI001966CF59